MNSQQLQSRSDLISVTQAVIRTLENAWKLQLARLAMPLDEEKP